MTSAAEDMPEVPERAVSGLNGWIECFERAGYAGGVFAGGVTAPGDIKGHPSLAKATIWAKCMTAGRIGDLPQSLPVSNLGF